MQKPSRHVNAIQNAGRGERNRGKGGAAGGGGATAAEGAAREDAATTAGSRSAARLRGAPMYRSITG